VSDLTKSDDQIGAFSFRPTPSDSPTTPPAGATPAGGIPRRPAGATPAGGIPRAGATPAGGIPRGATPSVPPTRSVPRPGKATRPTAQFENGAKVTVRPPAERTSRLGLSLILLTLCGGGAVIGVSRHRPEAPAEILVPISGVDRVDAATKAASAVETARARPAERVYSGRFWKADDGLWIALDDSDEESRLRIDPRSIARIVVREDPFAQEYFVLHDGTFVKNWPELYQALPEEVRLRVDYARATGRGNAAPVEEAEPTEAQRAARDAEQQRRLGDGQIFGIDYTDKVEAAPPGKPQKP